MAKFEIPELENLLNKSAGTLKHVTAKKMFGCHALWVNEKVFALVWKYGRIGFKIPVEDKYNSLMKISGSEPWKAGARQPIRLWAQPTKKS